MKAVFCIPTIKRPHQATLDALAASVPLLDAAGIEHAVVHEVGSPYISCARATMLRKALDAKADAIVFIDHDLSWRPADLVTLVQAAGDYVIGTYRFKHEPEEYMGMPYPDHQGDIRGRADGAILAYCGPAGFMKITPRAVNRVLQAHPELAYGDRHSPHVDFFNHGAHEHVWYGEDYAACRRWVEMGEQLWLLPQLQIDHHGADGKVYRGNFDRYLRRQPGGDLHDAPQ